MIWPSAFVALTPDRWFAGYHVLAGRESKQSPCWSWSHLAGLALSGATQVPVSRRLDTWLVSAGR